MAFQQQNRDAQAVRVMQSSQVRAAGAAWVWQLPLPAVAGDAASWIAFWALRAAPIDDVLRSRRAPILIGLPLLSAAFLHRWQADARRALERRPKAA